MTDLERLHEVALEHRTERGSGKTFLACHEIAQEILMEQPVIYYVAARISHIRHMMPMFMEILREHNIKIERRQEHTIWAGKSTVYFTSIEFIDYELLKHKKYSVIFDN